jgi:AraC-like DNA-binding protein
MAEQLKKEDLINDEQFLDDASEFLRQRTGNLYIDSEEIFENYLTHMRYHSSNDITPVRDLMFAQKADPEMKDKMARLFQTFDQLEPDANEDLLEVAQDYGISVLSSPSTWLGLITAGAGKVASLGAQQAARTGVRALLYQGIAKAPVTSGALAGAAVEGTAGYSQEKARQMARVEVGAQEEEDKTALGTTTVLAGALGGAGGALTGLIKKRQVAKASSLIDDANEATREATEAATARAEQTIAENADQADGVVARLRPLDEEAVKEGTELREQLSANELFIFDMDIATKKAIKAAAIDLIGPEDLAKDPQKRITEIVADRIRSGNLTTPEIDEIAERYNLSREQLSLIFTADVSDAARTLQAQGQLKKLITDIQQLSDEVVDDDGNVVRRGVELSEQQSEFISDVANGMGFLATETLGGVKGFERMRRAILTSQPQTTIRNFAGGAARILIDMPETLIENVTRKILNVFGAKYTPDSFRTDSLSILKYMAPISPTKEKPPKCLILCMLGCPVLILIWFLLLC